MKSFCFTVDDNIRFLKEITENNHQSIFEHPYLAMYKRLHGEFDLKVQLNLFYRMDGFDLSQMSADYYDEWTENTDWLKLSFHSELENKRPYEFSGYDEVFTACKAVNEQILRFASSKSLGKTTTVHCCNATAEGLKALEDQHVLGLLGLFGDDENPRTSYSLDENDAARLRNGDIVKRDNISFASIDIILNLFSKEEILTRLESLQGRKDIRVMIHEQFFYSDYIRYQADFEEKLRATFLFLCQNSYKSHFFEDLI